MKRKDEYYYLEMHIKHLEWFVMNYAYDYMSYHELCEYVYKVYTNELEPLRIRYHEGNLNERMHQLLTKGYKCIKHLSKDHNISWPPHPRDFFIKEQLNRLEDEINDLVEECRSIPRQIDVLTHQLKRLKKWNKLSN